MDRTWVDAVPALSPTEEARYRDLVAGAADLVEIVQRAARTERRNPALVSAARAEIAEWPADRQRRAVLAVHDDVVTAGCPTRWPPLLDLIVDALPWTRADLLWCLRHAERVLVCETGASYHLPARLANLVPVQALDDDVRRGLDAFAAFIRVEWMPLAERSAILALIRSATDRAAGTGQLSRRFLPPDDGFGDRARERIASAVSGPIEALFAHCAALDKPVPTRKWSEAARRLSDGLDDAVTAVVEAFVPFRGYLDDENDRLLRGLVHVLAGDPSDAATELLAGAALAAGAAAPRSQGFAYAPKSAHAAVEALAARGGDVPLRALARLAVEVRNKALRTRVESSLTRLGALRGWSIGQVMELAVDDHGLDRTGRRVIPIGAYTATVEISGDKGRLAFAKDGAPLKTVPTAVSTDHADELRTARDLVKAVTQSLQVERTRVESLMSQERTWTLGGWSARYLDHPVTGRFGRALIWEGSADGVTWASGWPERRDDGWILVDRDGEPLALPGDRAALRLWHPARAAADDVRAWRDHVVASGQRQPFKQAFREVYLVTPAEKETETYSNRYAAHILRYRQANALMRTRGWHANYLGTWDSGHNGEATKAFGDGDWRATFVHDLVENTDRADWEAHYCSTDQVRFARRDGTVWETARMTDVPTLVFSEAMRDVDLFIGVTSIAADPEWADRGGDRFHAYWSSTSFGALTASAEVRREVLTRVLPRLKIAGQCELTERFLRVRGTRATYKIHLGSANILMEPNDAYLCIVPARGKRPAVDLPFTDDGVLSVVLSKAILLAADYKITDPMILHQLPR